jgi:hypothetical protein
LGAVPINDDLDAFELVHKEMGERGGGWKGERSVPDDLTFFFCRVDHGRVLTERVGGQEQNPSANRETNRPLHFVPSLLLFEPESIISLLCLSTAIRRDFPSQTGHAPIRKLA